MFQQLTRAEFERDKAYRRNRRILVAGLILGMDYLIDALGGTEDPRLRNAARGTVVLSGWALFELANIVYNECYPLNRPGVHNAYGGQNQQVPQGQQRQNMRPNF